MERVRLARIEVPDYNLGLRGKLVREEKSTSSAPLAFSSILYGLTVTDGVVDTSFSNAENGYPDFELHVDEETRIDLPWRNSTSAVIGDLVDASGSPFGASPRGVLSRLTKRLQDRGLNPTLGYEFEFWILHDESRDRPDGETDPLGRVKSAYSWARMVDAADLVEEYLARMDSVGVQIDAFHTELGPGLFEFALAPMPALQAADAAVRAKMYMRELCIERGLEASFMAKPFGEESGAGGHLHSSFARSGENVFAKNPGELSQEGRQYLAGLLHTMPEFMVLFAPYINSYKRIDPTQFVSSSPSWGMDDRGAACRLLLSSQKAARVEHRIPGADVSPYFSGLGVLAGGLYGLEAALELDEVTDAVASTSLPMDLTSATQLFRNSSLAHQLLGEVFVETVSANRTAEIAEYESWLRTNITTWERARHLEHH